MADWLGAFVGEQVVIDTDAGYLAIGVLEQAAADHVVLTACDLHDHAEANSTKEVYVLESRRFGPRVNRQRVVLPRSRVVAVSRLVDAVS